MAEEPSNSQPATKKRVAVESLGWLTESSIMPRKHRTIEGVGASSILDLKAQLYKSQEESKRQAKEPIHSADSQYAQHLEVHRAKKIISNDAFANRNSGVEARAAKYAVCLFDYLVAIWCSCLFGGQLLILFCVLGCDWLRISYCLFVDWD